MKSTLLALPLIISPAFNAVSAQNVDGNLYQHILDYSKSIGISEDPVATARFYDGEDDYKIVPLFGSRDPDYASTVIPRDRVSPIDGEIERIHGWYGYEIIGDDYFQEYSGGFFDGFGAVDMETPHLCTADGMATVSLRAKVRPSMSDLANSEATLDDIGLVLSKIFSRYVQQALNDIDSEDMYQSYPEQILYPALTDAAAELEVKYDLTIADRPDLINYKGMTVDSLGDMLPHERERICPNPEIEL